MHVLGSRRVAHLFLGLCADLGNPTQAQRPSFPGTDDVARRLECACLASRSLK
jgi:hypothetical protein